MNGEKIPSERLKENPRIREALEESKKSNREVDDPESEVAAKSSPRIWFFFIVLLAAVGLYFLMNSSVFPLENRYVPHMQNLAAGLGFTMVLLIFNQLIRAYLFSRIDSAATRYNLRRIADLVVGLLILFIAISIAFSNWYGVVVSLGLISLILGLALQNPITSFFGWVYILIRKPYRVGDRIKIGGVTGDVISLSYFDTTLWEFRGDYLSSDHPSGRIIRFGNGKVFSEYIINYSWPLFPYIWNELNFFVSYESDLEFVATTVKGIVHEDMGPEMEERVELYRSLLQETPVDELEVRRGGSVGFRAHDNTWLEVVVRFLVEPKQSGTVKGRLFTKMMQALRAQPDRVMFPKTNMR